MPALLRVWLEGDGEFPFLRQRALNLGPRVKRRSSRPIHLTRANAMIENSHPVEVEEKFNAIVEEFGQFLRRAIVRFCPHDKGLQFDDIEQEARMRLWRALQRRER